MKTLLSLLIVVVISTTMSAQELLVKSFAKADGDLSAHTNARYDNNSVKCALVKIQYVGDIHDVEGNVVKPFVKRTNETWVYMTQRSRQMQVITKDYLPVKITFADYGVNALESGTTYLMVLSKPATTAVTQQDIGGNFIALSVSPANAAVYIDDIIQQQTSDGQYSAMLPYGVHHYKVEAGGCVSKSGSFTISGGEMSPIEVSLASAMATVSITCPTPAVSLYIDKKSVGNSPWSGNLKEGLHLVEAKKDGYRSQQKTIQLSQQQKLDVNLDALEAIQGSLSVNYKPFGADVYIDGEKVGQSPRVFNGIMIGSHKVEIKKEGFAEESKMVKVEEGQTQNLTGELISGLFFTVNGITFEMIPIQGGTLTMGATSEQGYDAYFEEKPAHQVTLSSYSIGKFEVTQALWQAVMGSNPSNWKGDNLPVETVRWNDCQEFLAKLNALTGKHFRLPTEAEWEYACRGGNKSQGYKYSGSNQIKNVAWYDGNSKSKTHEVGAKSPNELGIYDMSGNIMEWCSDWYGNYSRSSQINPQGSEKGDNRIARGGSWFYADGKCRSSSRNQFSPNSHRTDLGLRLVLSK